MEQMNAREQLIWAAGFLDGEGCISIIHRKTTDQYALTFRAAQMDIKPLEKLKEIFGGTIYRHKQDAHQWQVATRAASEVLRKIQPWLIVKRDQCDLALDFQSRRGKRFQLKTKAEREQDHEDYLEMQRLKKVRNP